MSLLLLINQKPLSLSLIHENPDAHPHAKGN